MKYILRNPNRKLSFVLRVIDSFTGLPIPGNNLKVSLKEYGTAPLIKPDGYCVFYDMPDGGYEVKIKCRGYFDETVSTHTGGEPVCVLMTPDRRYPVTSGMTWLEGRISPETEVRVISKEMRYFKLLRCEDRVITVLSLCGLDLANTFVAIGEPDNIRFVGDRVGDNRYAVPQSFLDAGAEQNTWLYPVSLGRAGYDGYLFCPIRGFKPEHTEVFVSIRGKTVNSPVTYGQGNTYIQSGEA